jgi:hypothetical protein
LTHGVADLGWCARDYWLAPEGALAAGAALDASVPAAPVVPASRFEQPADAAKAMASAATHTNRRVDFIARLSVVVKDATLVAIPVPRRWQRDDRL